MKKAMLKKVITVALLFGMAFVADCRAGQGYQTINTAELRSWLESASPPVLVYSLSQAEFEEQRISGSICVPMELMENSMQLPIDKAQPLVFYCHGPG